MAEYKTSFGIGDVVYTASEDSVEKQIVTRIKISGLKHTISYGFKDEQTSYAFFWRAGETWYKSSEVFDTYESANRKHESSKAKSDAESAQSKRARNTERKAELLEELKELEGEQ